MAMFTNAIARALRVAILSPECAIVLAAIAVGAHWGDVIVASCPDSMFREGVFGWLALLPAALLGFSVYSWRDLLSPDHPAVRALVDWPDKDRLLLTFTVGLAYQLLFAAAAALLWVFDSLVKTQYGLPIFGFSIIGAIVSAATHYLGAIRLRLLLDTVKQA